MCPRSFFFFFNDTATTEIYTLSLHDALPIFLRILSHQLAKMGLGRAISLRTPEAALEEIQRNVSGYDVSLANLLLDRKSTRLNSSHSQISYAVFCLKKKKKNTIS